MSHATSAGRGRRERTHARRGAIIAGAGLLAVTVVAFFGKNPVSHPYEIRGVFASANQLRVGSDVRIAGFTIGKVSRIQGGPGHSSVVTMQIDDAGRPIKTDAELSIEPRLLLEGNFFVSVRNGNPGAPELRSGGTIDRAHTSIPVQLDQVLDTFDLATRGALHRSVAEIGDALGAGTGNPAATPIQSPVRGSAALRRATREFGAALPSATTVSHALRGTSAGDLGRSVRSFRDVTQQLAADPAALADSVTNFNGLVRTLADEDDSVTASVGAIDRLVRSAPGPLRALDRALPSVTRLAAAARPAVALVPRAVRRTMPFVDQLSALFSRRELPELLDGLAPALANLPALENGIRVFAPLGTRANNCLSDRVVWTLDQKLKDGANTTGDPVWLDALHGEAGAGGVVSGFDGNGVALRAGITGNGVTLSGLIPGLGRIAGQSPTLEGVRPAWLGYGIEPAYRPDQWCDSQPRPDLAARSGPPPTLPTGGRTARVGGILP